MAEYSAQELLPIVVSPTVAAERVAASDNTVSTTCCGMCAVKTFTAAEARDYLANVRTFLSWQRTALNIATLSVAVYRLLNEHMFGVAMALICVSIVILVYSIVDFVKQQRVLHHRQVMFNIGAPAVVGSMLGALLFAVLINAIVEHFIT